MPSPQMLLMTLLLLVSTGCMSVNRRMTVRTDPPGAMVRIDGRDIGFTPVAVDFTHYGTREITLIKDGYETLTTLQTVRPPWYQVFPLDFVSDNFLPVRIQNRHEFDYTMHPKLLAPSEEILGRANSLRSEALIQKP